MIHDQCSTSIDSVVIRPRAPLRSLTRCPTLHLLRSMGFFRVVVLILVSWLVWKMAIKA